VNFVRRGPPQQTLCRCARWGSPDAHVRAATGLELEASRIFFGGPLRYRKIEFEQVPRCDFEVELHFQFETGLFEARVGAKRVIAAAGCSATREAESSWYRTGFVALIACSKAFRASVVNTSSSPRRRSIQVLRKRKPGVRYRGLQIFREEDAAFFAGRKAFAKQLLDFTLAKNLVAVVGPSGSGKSHSFAHSNSSRRPTTQDH
jgi:hypothetical protein